VLEVPRTATEDELKIAYRLAARKWHPDKNRERWLLRRKCCTATEPLLDSVTRRCSSCHGCCPLLLLTLSLGGSGRADEAHLKFQEIQNAYETLSDPQERAWYDGHREQILRGGTGGTGEKQAEAPPTMTLQSHAWPASREWSHSLSLSLSPLSSLPPLLQDDIDLFEFMYAGCYNGYEGAKGFFGCYYKVFETLAKEEREAKARRQEMGDLSSDEEGEHAAPVFGDHDTQWDYVDGFYKYWQSFSSKRSFYWADKFDLRTAPDRFVKRKAEAENNRLRREARKKASMHVRELVSFVRRRDPRVQEHMKAVEEEKQRKKDAYEERKEVLPRLSPPPHSPRKRSNRAFPLSPRARSLFLFFSSSPFPPAGKAPGAAP